MRKKKDNPIDFGSYSDLFMVMSFVFLFMYVISSINTGITVIQERHRADAERKKLTSTVAKYERKIETELDAEQKKEYERLKEGLLKLKSDAREAREYQEKMVHAAREKEKELDLYQETIKTMMLDQIKVADRMKQKDEIINKVKEESAAIIRTQERSIASLKEDLQTKNEVLEEKTKEVEQRSQEVQRIAKRVDELKHKEVLAANQAKELSQLSQTLAQKETELQSAKVVQETLKQEKENLYKASVTQVNRLSEEKEKLAQRTQAELDRLESEKRKLAEQTGQELENLKQQKAAELAQLKKEKDSELKGLQAKYQKATEGLRKEIANSLARKLRDSGLSASVNPSTGDVTVHFKNAYYDYNSSVLKESMKEELKVFIPLYAKSLFENKKYAGSISSVEIIGSSSPSFKGKYVNPRAMASVDEKKAMTYNLDLSYRRAKSIFDFTFLSTDLAFAHKDEMIPLIKVSGTGYLQAMDELVAIPEGKQDKSKGFCGLYNCEVFQKVTLRFNLKDKVTQK